MPGTVMTEPMPSEPPGAAMESGEANAPRSDAVTALPASRLAELAAAIARIERLIVSGAREEPDFSGAVERIADIAFVLHERDVERSLCDALDAAVRDISAAAASQRARAARTQEAAGLLRELARDAGGLMALISRDRPAVGRAGGEEFPGTLFQAEIAEDDQFAGVIAALAASLPPATTETEPDARSMEAAAARHDGNQAAAIADAAAERAEAQIIPPPPSGPDEDPGDLFEPVATALASAPAAPALEAVPPVPVPASPIVAAAAELVLAPSAEVVPVVNAGAASPVPPPPALPQKPAAASALPPQRPTTNDPLAPIRALSEEEIIALFT